MHIIMCHWHKKRHFPLAALVLRTCHHARNTLSKAPILYMQFCSGYALLCPLYQACLHTLEIAPCRAIFIFAISLREKCKHVFCPSSNIRHFHVVCGNGTGSLLSLYGRSGMQWHFHLHWLPQREVQAHAGRIIAYKIIYGMHCQFHFGTGSTV